MRWRASRAARYACCSSLTNAAVLVRVETAPQLGEHVGDITAQKCLDGEPQAGEDRAVDNPGGVGLQPLVIVVRQHEPVDLPVVDPPDDILPDAVAAVDA